MQTGIKTNNEKTKRYVQRFRNFLSLNTKYEEKIIIFGRVLGALTSNPGVPKLQGSKTSSQSRHMYFLLFEGPWVALE